MPSWPSVCCAKLDCWEIVTPAQMAIVTFRYIPTDGDAELADEITHRLVGRLLDDGSAFASGTRLRGRPVMRICANNPRTSEADLRGTVALLGRLAADLQAALTDQPGATISARRLRRYSVHLRARLDRLVL